MSAAPAAPAAPSTETPVLKDGIVPPGPQVSHDDVNTYKFQENDLVFELTKCSGKKDATERAVPYYKSRYMVYPWQVKERFFLIFREKTFENHAPNPARHTRAAPRQQQPPAAAPSAPASNSGDVARLVALVESFQARVESFQARCTALEARVQFLENCK